MGFIIQEYQDFRGNVLELSALAIRCSNFLSLPGDTDKINERTIRYYVTEGLVDRPTRIGRDAEYEYIHLLQFLASRYLVGSGYPMAKVAPYIASRSMEDLAKFVSNPSKPNLAELLVASFAERSSTLSAKNRTPRQQNTAMQSAGPRMSKMQAADDLIQTPAFLRKSNDQDALSQGLKGSASKSSKSLMQDLFANEALPEEATPSKSREVDDACRREIARLQNQMRMMQKSFEDSLTQMSDRLEGQANRHHRFVEQSRHHMEDLLQQFQQERYQWQEELQKLQKIIHDRLPPIDEERAPSSTAPLPERAQASNAQDSVPPKNL